MQITSYIKKLHLRSFVILALLAAFALAGLTALRLIKRDPSVAVLSPEGGAQWIIIDEPVILKTRRDPQELTSFRTSFTVTDSALPSSKVLTIRAMKLAAVYLDGELIEAPRADKNDWKKPIAIDLHGRLSPGAHELGVRVTNNYGPAMLLVYSPGLGITTGSGWEASKDEVNWAPAATADRYRYAEISRLFPRADRAFASSLYVIIPVFAVIFFVTLGNERGISLCSRLTPSAQMIRRAVLLAWLVLIINNIDKTPFAGFDLSAHIEYIQYVAKNWRIPLATEGWQMFQSPLYYIISAMPYKILTGFLAEEPAVRVLLIIPLVSGMLFSETAFRAARHIWPERPDLQAIGALTGGLLPMNIYMSHTISNETMAGIFSAGAITAAIGIVSAKNNFDAKHLLLLGALLGLALLSKVTAVLLIPVFFIMLIWKHYPSGGARQAASSLVMVFGAAGAISAWYYIRNWVLLGRPFIGGWDSSREIMWWQFPGYRTPGQFYRFGESLLYPVYSSINGFWDSIYSTIWADGALSDILEAPWDHDLMTAGVWLAIVPTVAIVVGIIKAFKKEDTISRPGEIFSVMMLAIYLMALLYMYLRVPIFSTAKGSYTMGITPVYAVLCAAGIGVLARGAFLKAVFYGAIGSWAVVSFAAYLII